jgi:molybdenum cofactor cytidylyltransferase
MGPERNKLVEPIAGRPLVAWPVDACLEAGIDPVLVVTGFEAERVRLALGERDCRYVQHAGWSEGMGSTLARGMQALRALSPRSDAVLVCVGDLPGLRAAHVKAILDAVWAAGGNRGSIPPEVLVVPTHGARRGHPVLFGASYFAALERLTGDEGARKILEQHKSKIRPVDLATEAILQDVDTPADLAEARSQPPLTADEKA